MKEDPIPGWWPDDARTEAHAHVEVHIAAARRIRRNRRRLTQAHAETIVLEDATRTGIGFAQRHVQKEASILLTPPWWPWLHPRKARKQGWRFEWEKDDS